MNKSQWIDVNERLPEDETPVLVLFYNKTMNIGALFWEEPSYEENFDRFQYWDNPTDDGQVWDWADITHWMPLPQPPEQKD